MELNALQAFIQTARFSSFSVAADHLFITQSAISKRISNLEQELNAPLFDRFGRKVQLTPFGKSLLPKARQLLSDAEELRQLAKDFSNDVSGEILIGTSHHIGLHRLPDFIKRYTASYPDVKLDIRFLDSETACQQVETGELEMAIVTLPEEKTTSLQLQTIWHDQLAIMTNKKHPLAKKKNINLTELVEYPAVLPGSATYTRRILDQALAKQKLKPVVAMSTNYLEILKMLVEAGQGWSLLPVSMSDKRLIEIKTSLNLARSLGIVTHKNRTLTNPALALVELLTFQDH